MFRFSPATRHPFPFSCIGGLPTLAILSAAALLAPSAQAQADRGSVAGTVTDTTKAVLQGAQVTLEPGGQTATTNQEGSYIIAGVKPGSYTVTVSYLGFAPSTSQVDVAAGAIAKANAAMAVNNASSTVTVRPEREVGEAEALNRQRVAVNIEQVLPSEVINSLPNVNIADAVGRMPSVSVERDEGEAKYIQIRGTEPRLNFVTVDGFQLPSPENVRNVKLDTIPADLVESVEINKTLTANMDADGIGGTVNLVTRTATDEPYFAVEGLYGHTPINGGRGQDQVFATYGRRYLADKKLGFLITGSYDWNGRGIDDIEPGQAVNAIIDTATGNATGQTVNAPNTIDLRNYFYDRSRYGLGGTLDYKFSDRTSVYLKSLYSYFDDFGEDSINTLNAGNFISTAATDNNGSAQYANVYRRPVQQIFSFIGGGSREFARSRLVLRAALSQAKLTGGYNYSSFNGPGPTSDANGNPQNDGVGYAFSAKDPFLPHLTPTNANVYDPSLYSLNDISFQDNHTFQRDAVGQADYSRTYTQGQAFGTWQIGFKVRDVVKNQNYNQSDATVNGSAPLLNQFLTDRGNTSYYFGQYQSGPQSKATEILSYYNKNQNRFSIDPETARNLRNDFNIQERVYAGYAMNTFTYARFRLNTGIRVDATSDLTRGNQPDAAGVVAPVNFNTGYIFVLPSVNAQYNLSNYTDFRLAYSIGISRPNYGDLAPYLTYDPTASNTAGNPALTAGNPNLQPTWAHNLDLLGEHYLRNVGVIQGGLFYKMLYNYIAISARQVGYTTPGAAAPALFYETAPLNVSSAHLIGVEASWEQHLTELPGSLSGIGFRANYSYTASVAGYPGRSDHPTLQRDAPNNYNFDATYDKYGISARMGITHNDAYLWAYAYQDGTPIAGQATTPTPSGIAGPQSDTYIYPHTQVDAQASYLLPKARGVSVVAQFLNLNNEVFGFYNGSQRYPIQREYYSPTYTFGLKWTPGSEHGSIFHN